MQAAQFRLQPAMAAEYDLHPRQEEREIPILNTPLQNGYGRQRRTPLAQRVAETRTHPGHSIRFGCGQVCPGEGHARDSVQGETSVYGRLGTGGVQCHK